MTLKKVFTILSCNLISTVKGFKFLLNIVFRQFDLNICRHGLFIARFSTANSEANDDYFQRILQRFPGGRCLSFAYGSGVFQQDGQKRARDNMTDLVLAVDDPGTWHKHNLLFNPKDYSGLICDKWYFKEKKAKSDSNVSGLMRTLGPKVISDVQDKWAARMYFNTLIPFEDGKIKYGVISR